MNIEILAPAGSPESVTAAVRCGADAVYLGGDSFSARQNAANFNKEELRSAVEYCHLHGVKVHQAVNTIIFDTQIKDLEETVRYAAEIGIDAVIVQDLGVLSVVKSLVPDMPVHASTQMTINTPEGVLFAKRLGFSRVVLARELSKEQIKEMTGLGIETEVFVHGAMCMSISGQCYMSAMIGSRSADRGLCAQACRLPFSGLDGISGRHDLSLKDMCLAEYVNELSDIGVTSLKIEGRMKRPEYTAAATSSYRDAADGRIPDINALRAVFSRSGFTDGYFRNSLGSDMFGIREKEDVISADAVFPKLRELYRKEKKSSSVRFFLKILKGKPMELEAFDGCGIKVNAVGEFPQEAINRSVDISMAEKQLTKLGGTIYEYEGIEADIQDCLSVSASSLNNLRREAIEKLNIERINKNTPVYSISEENIPLYFAKTLDIKHKSLRIMIDRTEQLSKYSAERAEFIIVPIKELNKNIDKFAEYKEKIIISLPSFLAGYEKEYEKLLTELYASGYKRIYCINVSHIEVGLKYGFIIHGGTELNISNSLALEKLSQLKAADTAVSFEMKLSQIAALGDFMPYGILAYGRIPLMKTRNCPVKNAVKSCSECTEHITDRTGRVFPVTCNGITSEILNSDILYMADRMNEADGISFYILKFHEETADEIEKIVRMYENGEKPPFSKFTRGLYYRGIL